jgi:2'-5' RNA ligase
VAARPGTHRLFIAIPVPEDVRTAVAALIDEVRGGEIARSRIRWVRTDGLHLTVRFLGPTAADRIPALTAAIDGCAERQATFGVRLAGAGGFPNPVRPRALWLGITEGFDALADLVAGFGPPLAALGWPPDERPYRPHLTLARTDGAPDGPATVDRLAAAAALMESHTGRGPARYETVHAAALAARPSDP